MITWRPATAADVPALAALLRTIEDHDDLDWLTSDETLTHEFATDIDDPKRDSLLTFDGDDLCAFGWISKNRGGERKHRAIIDFGVGPRHRSRDAEIGEPLLGWLMARSEEILTGSSGDLPRVIRCWADSAQQWRMDLLERFGLAPARYFSMMARPLDTPLPEMPETPGVTIVPWDDRRGEPVRTIHNAAFADHWGSEPMEADMWRDVILTNPHFRPDLSFVAVDVRGQIVAYVINEVWPEEWEKKGYSEGWVAVLGVLREHRKRGVASGLLVRSLEAFTAQGYDQAGIGVDAASETGANRLYERLGFVTRRTSVTYTRELLPRADGGSP